MPVVALSGPPGLFFSRPAAARRAQSPPAAPSRKDLPRNRDLSFEDSTVVIIRDEGAQVVATPFLLDPK